MKKTFVQKLDINAKNQKGGMNRFDKKTNKYQ
jgi:hypothetical protein